MRCAECSPRFDAPEWATLTGADRNGLDAVAVFGEEDEISARRSLGLGRRSTWPISSSSRTNRVMDCSRTWLNRASSVTRMPRLGTQPGSPWEIAAAVSPASQHPASARAAMRPIPHARSARIIGQDRAVSRTAAHIGGHGKAPLTTPTHTSLG